MTKVITYGTYDYLHYGHIRLLERAKALGDYLIVGVTADDFDKTRGKINVQQSLMERIAAVKDTGLADEIIVEEYEGQKIDDIKKYDVDIFTVGSDWVGKFDYLKDYCKVVYLDRTEGISSTDIRAASNIIRIGMIGNTPLVSKYISECNYVNGVEVVGIFANEDEWIPDELKSMTIYTDFSDFLEEVDAVFVISHPQEHYSTIKKCLSVRKHVLCESPISLSKAETEELFELAANNHCTLYDSIKTAYSTAYKRAQLLIKAGKIGDVVSVSTTCTSLREKESTADLKFRKWNSICAWGPTALLPIFQLLGTDYKDIRIISKMENEDDNFDGFSKIDFVYQNSVASALVGKSVKSEGELIISGTQGYVFIPAPWWKTDYFEIRYENPANNKRYFYQLDGEGIRYEIVSFVRSINRCNNNSEIEIEESKAISTVIEDFYHQRNTIFL